MCDQTEVNYTDGDIVWVKLGSCFWPGEVVGFEKLPADFFTSFKKPPIAVVKFFQEDTYEYVKNPSAICKYECSRKNLFIQKGLDIYRKKHGPMEKFPEDVIRAETAVGGDIEILTRDEFQETKKESYADLFVDPRRTPASTKKGKSGKGRSSDLSMRSTPIRMMKEKPNYQVHILVQGSKTPIASQEETPSTSRAGSEPSDEKPKEIDSPTKSVPSSSTPTMSSSGIYACHSCPFSTSRLNVLVLHNKTHSTTFMPYIPTPIKKKSLKTHKSPKPSSATAKVRKPRQNKMDKETDQKGQKREADKNNGLDDNLPDAKKAKTDEEIKSSLLADWDDEDDSIEEEAVAAASSPEVPVAAGSPAVPTSAELPSELVSSECELELVEKKKEELVADKPESSNDAKYDFCEDEDWPVEADVGRKIPRVKPLKRKEDTKSIDENDVAREVAELLTKTSVPELPSVSESLKVEENFPELSIVKSPDKNQKSPVLGEPPEQKLDVESKIQKPIFKTKTFFRSRHSRSQDAIGKYVAEQLNAAERLDMLDNDMNGTQMSPSPEPISPPNEQAKVARLAPKIQLKKMKAESAQLREQAYTDEEVLNEENSVHEVVIEKECIPKITENNCIETCDNVPLIDTNTDSSADMSTAKIQNPEVIDSPIETPTDSEQSKDINHVLQDCDTTLDSSKTHKESEGEKDTVNVEVAVDTQYKSYMSESTASAVDALLSVSREADRVTKVISVDPPEDLFEDDHKECVTTSNMNTSLKALNGIENDISSNSPVQQAKEKYLTDDLSTNTSDSCITSTTENENNQNLSEPEVSKLDIQIDNIPNDEIMKSVSQEIQCNADDQKNDGDPKQNDEPIKIVANIPSESDLQIAETLINLPSTTLQNKSSIAFTEEIAPVNLDSKSVDDISKDTISDNPKVDIHENVIADSTISAQVLTKDIRFESEEEKCENLNAAQSLVQMSESIEHKISVLDVKSPCKDDSSSVEISNIKQQGYNDKTSTIKLLNSNFKENEKFNGSTGKIETTSKLLKILEEPSTSRVTITNNAILNKKAIVPTKAKVLNTHVNKSIIKPKQVAKQQIIIRRTTPSKLLNNVTEVTTADKIILSRTNKASADGSAVQSYTIQTSPNIQTDKKTIIIQPKIRKITKTTPKLQKIKPQITSAPTIINSKLSQSMKQADTVFDINSMPIVLSDDVLTPESIENMPIVMSDGNILTSSPAKLVKNKKISEKITVTSSSTKQDNKGISTHIVHDVNKLTPNILSKSSKLRSPKTMLVIDKSTVKQKLIMTKSETSSKDIKQTHKILQAPKSSPKTEKFVILPKPNSPRPARTQKIVIDPQTGKAHVVVEKGPVNRPASESKPVSAKLIPSSADSKTPGSTVMIITNEQGTQSRIVLTPEHEKILFPNKQQTNISQLKTITHLISTNSSIQQKSIITSVAAAKTPTRIVSKPQKSAIITSKGQLILGGRLAPTTQNIAPLPEIRPATKRLAEPKKIAPMAQKQGLEPLIFLQKSGTVMQLTVSQFEHLQRTGQIVQKVPAQEKVIVQKTITMSPTETIVPAQKTRIRKQLTESAVAPKKMKHEINIAPAPPPVLLPAPALIPVPVPALTPICSTTTNITVTNNNVSNTNASTIYPNMDNFEELLPTTAIARPTESILAPTEQNSQAAVPPISDGQLLAVPGEHFGGPQGSFYLCVEDNGTFTAIDNRPLVLENNQLVPMPDLVPVQTPQPERRDILEAALANSDVFHAESTREEAPDFRDLNANVSVHCRVSETSSTLNQPIMTPVEVPTKANVEPVVPANLDDGLAVIGVTPHTVPTSLELPITVTDPRIALKTTDPLSNSNYRMPLLPSPNTEMTFVVTEETDVCSMVGPISMPLLTTEEESVGKSMPILIDEITERTVSSVESTVGSPSSIEIRESETEDSSQWPRRLHTPGSDISEASVEIPLQPPIQLSVSDLSH